MTYQLTDEAIQALLDGTTEGPWEAFIDDSGGQWTGWPLSIEASAIADKTVVRTGGQWPYEWDAKTSQDEACQNARLIAAAPDLARALLDARAENDRLKKDAQAAVALVVKQCADEVRGSNLGLDINDIADDLLALAPADALGAVGALQRDVHSLVAAICDSWDERDRLAAELAAAQQREAVLAAAEAQVGALVKQLVDLEKVASEVSRRGAVTGPQWTKLTITILATRAALAQNGRNGE